MACCVCFMGYVFGTSHAYGQESESAEIGFLWGPKHEQFSNASLSALNLKKHFET